jgi:large subunit ribosomal protein L10
MPNYVMDEQGVKALANMPSREELLATLLGTLQAPVTKFARTLNEVPGKFVRTLAALEEKRKAEA